MSALHPSRVTRRLLKLASFGLAGLLAGLLTGCSSSTAARITHLDTDWHTSSTYASATASYAADTAAFRSHIGHTAHARPCFSASCGLHTASNHLHPAPHRTM